MVESGSLGMWVREELCLSTDPEEGKERALE
jgi:hypothetical protein